MPSLDQLKALKGKRKTFKQQPPLLIIPESAWGETTYVNDRRYYHCPDGVKRPSVTTFLGYFEDDSWRAKWVAGLEGGEAEAQAISERACHRGELVHKCLELYVTNDPNWNEMDANQYRFMFNQIRRVIDRKLDAVCYSEHALYSAELGLAGRVDLCGIWNGELAIIDFKNKNRLSKREDIEDYFIQCTIYAIMHKCMYGVLPKKIVVLLAVEDHVHRECQVVVENTIDWVPKVMEMARKFKAEGGFKD
jgi:hypothetical protein